MEYDHRDGIEAGGARRDAAVAEGARRRVGATHVATAVVLAAYAWWVVRLTPFSGEATVAVVLTGATAMVVGAWQRRRAHPLDAGDTVATRGTARWAVLAVVAGAWQLAAYLQHPRTEHPTVSSLTNALLDSHMARAAAFLVWIAVARELARR